MVDADTAYTMVVGVVRLSVRLPDNHSLKGKRQVISSLIGRIRSRFNVAVSETAYHDLWQLAEIGITTIGNRQPVIDAALNKILDFIEGIRLVEVIETDIEIIHFNRQGL
ncbi:MAG: DUF503 domain-containing protein [Dissulfurimicrobium sp.]|uniref:DUF503 domain-containing protein n=1 Tax=Dissulfurimicrobium TaxID=1769732 RepID=UPI001EDC4B11|nr:DUF503 domain-containing protein [Dissulfurimicrobium hydrothermale]UKL14025.1 DUF503 domain-containing protein [Dissulfurimicrobium hydrothermale]